MAVKYDTSKAAAVASYDALSPPANQHAMLLERQATESAANGQAVVYITLLSSDTFTFAPFDKLLRIKGG